MPLPSASSTRWGLEAQVQGGRAGGGCFASSSQFVSGKVLTWGTLAGPLCPLGGTQSVCRPQAGWEAPPDRETAGDLYQGLTLLLMFIVGRGSL